MSDEVFGECPGECPGDPPLTLTGTGCAIKIAASCLALKCSQAILFKS